jgi:hypothetical protein
MFQRQGMFLKWGVAVGQGRVAGVAGFRRKTEIGQLQILQLADLSPLCSFCTLLGMVGVKRQQEKGCQSDGREQEEL